ncbi:MAG: hypothetical protein ACT4OE_03125 [Sphingosinicella sp.]
MLFRTSLLAATALSIAAIAHAQTAPDPANPPATPVADEEEASTAQPSVPSQTSNPASTTQQQPTTQAQPAPAGTPAAAAAPTPAAPDATAPVASATTDAAVPAAASPTPDPSAPVAPAALAAEGDPATSTAPAMSAPTSPASPASTASEAADEAVREARTEVAAEAAGLAPAADPGPTIVAVSADIVAGAQVFDPQGGLVGAIESVETGRAVLAVGMIRARLPFASFAKNNRGLVISMTRAQIEAAVAAQTPTP